MKKEIYDKRLPGMFFLIAFILLLSYGFVASAGILTIKIQTFLKTEGDTLKGIIKVWNKGNVAAHNVRTDIIILGERLNTPVKKLIGIDQFETFPFEKNLEGIKKGRYPLTIMVNFHDANQHPFSALSCRTFFFKKDVKADLLGLIDGINIKKKGDLRFEIKNLGSGLKDIRASLILPKELSSPRTQVDLQIEPGRKKSVHFEIENFSALSGASYPIFGFLEYDLRETHYTAISRAIVTIAKEENWFRRTRWSWLGVGLLLGVAFILYQWVHLKKVKI